MRGVVDYPLVCKDIPKYTGNLKMRVNGSKADIDFGCERICASYCHLAAHLESSAGQICPRKLLVDHATLAARKCRLENQACNYQSPQGDTPDISTQNAISAIQAPCVDSDSLQAGKGSEKLPRVEATTVQNSSTVASYSSQWKIRMEGNSHGVSGSYVHIEVESLCDAPRSSPNFWELKFGDCSINPHDNRILRNGRNWMFLAPVPSFSNTNCHSVRVPLSFRVGWEKNGKDVLLYVGEFTYDYVHAVVR